MTQEVRVLGVLAGEPWVCGDTLTLPAEKAAQLIAEGRAEPVGPDATVMPIRQPRRKTG